MHKTVPEMAHFVDGESVKAEYTGRVFIQNTPIRATHENTGKEEHESIFSCGSKILDLQ